MDSSPGPGARCPAIRKKDKPMDFKIQVKKTSVTGGTVCKQPGKKKAKEKEFSVERLHILRWRCEAPIVDNLSLSVSLSPLSSPLPAIDRALEAE
ncbi:hypothetical protein AVEN_221248-1 [Araneus ventricosus]|uniref:Uncharacterized protein n=1 Tax=Araneus ventricosus TaxID=182803 RepID=A0A4Y2F6X6_ARAVE|nr:hypothetical protein AVEN_221248-1 [Araneus ventricosus]